MAVSTAPSDTLQATGGLAVATKETSVIVLPAALAACALAVRSTGNRERGPAPWTARASVALSSAIAARLALGDDLIAAVRAAKIYVTRAIAQAPGLGRGHGPLQHFVK